eukprot:5043662-Prymnesium_polylepis.1
MLAARILRGKSSEKTSLITLRRGESMKPLFIVHPAGGQLACYRTLLSHLPATQPVFAFEVDGTTSNGSISSLESVAERYVRQVWSAQTSGNFTVAGWSSGGLVAFEMARQLVDAGHAVDRVILIDTPAPHRRSAPTECQIVQWFLDDLQLGLDVSIVENGLAAEAGARERITSALGQLPAGSLPDIELHDLLGVYHVFSSIVRASSAYCPAPATSIKVELVRATRLAVHEYFDHPHNDLDDWGWHHFTGSAGVVTHWLNGTHYSLLNGTSAQYIAAVIAGASTKGPAYQTDSNAKVPFAKEHTVQSAAAGANDTAWCMCAPEVAEQKASAEAQLHVELPIMQRVDEDTILRSMHAAGLQVDTADTPFVQVGLHSLQAVRLRNALQQAVSDRMVLPVTLLFEHSSVRQLCSFLDQGPCHADAPCSLANSNCAIRLHAACIQGVSCNLPSGTDTLHLLRHVTSTSTDVLLAHGGRRGYLLFAPELFAHAHFSMLVDEATNMDPQQRHVLEQSYAAFHRSGMVIETLRGAKVGVSVGIWSTEFASLQRARGCSSVYHQQNISISVASGRVSFALGLHGPCTSTDTACSSSL